MENSGPLEKEFPKRIRYQIWFDGGIGGSGSNGGDDGYGDGNSDNGSGYSDSDCSNDADGSKALNINLFIQKVFENLPV